MDSTTNDLPKSAGFKIAGFPTLKFKPAGSKEFIDYDGDRSLESLIEFVQTNAKNKISQPDTAAPSSTESVSEPTSSASAPVHDHDHDHEEL
jgi:protein disulfide-isomerase A1